MVDVTIAASVVHRLIRHLVDLHIDRRLCTGARRLVGGGGAWGRGQGLLAGLGKETHRNETLRVVRGCIATVRVHLIAVVLDDGGPATLVARDKRHSLACRGDDLPLARRNEIVRKNVTRYKEGQRAQTRRTEGGKRTHGERGKALRDFFMGRYKISCVAAGLAA